MACWIWWQAHPRPGSLGRRCAVVRFWESSHAGSGDRNRCGSTPCVNPVAEDQARGGRCHTWSAWRRSFRTNLLRSIEPLGIGVGRQQELAPAISSVALRQNRRPNSYGIPVSSMIHPEMCKSPYLGKMFLSGSVCAKYVRHPNLFATSAQHHVPCRASRSSR